MANITIRQLPDDIHGKLKQLAAKNNRSTEAEVRHILAATVAREIGGGLGSLMRQSWGKNVGGYLEVGRSTEGPRKVSFE